MKLENGYKIIYEAPKRVTVEKPNKLYSSKTLPSINDTMLIAYNNGETAVSLKSFKLIYSDGKHLFGSTTNIPTENDVNIVLKSGTEIVFGKVIEVVAPVVNTVRKSRSTKTATQEE